MRFIIRQDKWRSYVVESQQKVMKYKSLDSVEDAGVIAATIVNFPEGSPFLKSPAQLESYIRTVSAKYGRNIVVVDRDKRILADSIEPNVGSIYNNDQKNEVASTITDGQSRDFIEKSADYPSGISETVISFKDAKGSVVGAIIISNSNIFN
ncbi:MAG TPA: hypothetical protein VG965_00790 [Patescibacteria group bacterium]|nr:hypothetical protein [Patescibacteria group bacterium]